MNPACIGTVKVFINRFRVKYIQQGEIKISIEIEYEMEIKDEIWLNCYKIVS